MLQRGELLTWNHSEYNERNTPGNHLWIVPEDEKCQRGKPCRKLLKSVFIFFSLPNNLTDFFSYLVKKKVYINIFLEKFKKFYVFLYFAETFYFYDAQTFL